jgi:epsilon-lactone hydrolase
MSPSRESESHREFILRNKAFLDARPDLGIEGVRLVGSRTHELATEPGRVTYEEAQVGGRPGLWCRPVDADATDRVILYAHGGGLIAGSISSYRKMVAHLARATGIPALIVEYRLAPEHLVPAQLEDMLAAYRWLREQGFDAPNIASVGDSAGANLATALVVALRSADEPVPGAVVALSPWYDLESAGETLDTNAHTDARITREYAERIVDLVMPKGMSRSLPQVNPLHADLMGFPPVYLAVGGYEALLDDSTRFESRARNAGVDVTLEISAGQQHIYPLMAGRSPEADETIHRIARWLRQHLNLAS